MGKIPIGRTLSETFGFVFGRYPALLGIFWLPFLIICAGYYFLFAPFFAHFIAAAQSGHPPANPFQDQPDTFRWFATAELVFVLLATMIRVGVVKEALGVRRGPRFIYLWFGAAELRALAAYFILFALMYASILAILVAWGAAAAVIYLPLKAAIDANMVPANAMTWLTYAAIAAGVATVAAWIYFALRVSFLVIPIIVVEKKIGIVRCWELMKGNVLRVVPMFIVLLLSLYVAEILALIAIVGPIAVFAGSFLSNLPAADAAPAAWLGGNLKFFVAYGLFVLMLFVPVIYGLMLSPAAFAYRALVPEKPEAPTAAMTEFARP